jgi:hypothetical protein
MPTKIHPLITSDEGRANAEPPVRSMSGTAFVLWLIFFCGVLCSIVTALMGGVR